MKPIGHLLKIAIVTLAASHAAAGGLFTPISMDSTGMLPKGVRNVRIGGFTTEVADKYDGFGQVVPTANGFNKPITIDKLISARPDLAEQAQLRGGLQAEGLDLNSTAGDAQGLVNARITTSVPIFAYGLTDKITLGMAIPIMYSAMHVDTGWAATQTFSASLARLQTLGYEGRILGLQSDLNNVVSTQIRSYGYKPLVDQQGTDMGDVTLGSKYLVHSDRIVDVAITNKLVLPTGRTPDVDKVVDIAPGDGRVSAGAGVVADFKASSKVTITPSASYLYQFSNDQVVRIPRTGDESISPDKDYNVHVKKGDIMAANMAAKYQFMETVGIGGGYSLQYKNGDSYQGSAYDSVRYSYLERDTWQNMQSMLISLSASTIPLFKKKQFAIPLDASISFAHVIDGRNVGRLDVAIFDFAAYF